MKKFYLIISIISVCLINRNLAAQGDNCVTAVQITTPGTYTADGPATGGGASQIGAVNADWYYYTATIDTFVEISACNDPGDIDSRLWVWSGPCGVLTLEAQSDDDCNTSGFSSFVVFPVANGTTYYIEWDDAWEPFGFDFEFNYTTSASNCNADFFATINDLTLTVSFFDASLNANDWWWDFDDGTEDSLSQNPVHIYAAPGQYSVWLYIEDTTTGCIDSVYYFVTVGTVTGCAAGFTYTTDSSLTVQFFDASVMAADWYWDFGDGTDLWGVANTTHTFPFSGLYDVCLSIADSTFLCFDDTCMIIEVPLGGSHCTNGVLDGGETDVDCGGADCPPCGGFVGGCAYDNAFLNSYIAPSVIGNLISECCIKGGEYITVTGMVAGSVYRVSTCGTDNFDTQVTIFKSGDPTALANNDDACGTQSEIFFYPPFNGDYDILVDEFSCVSNAIPTPLVVELVGVSGSGCPYANDYWYSVPAPTNPSDTFFEGCINGGEYITITNMIAGNTYYIATCGNTNFDSEITIYPSGGGIPVAYNNDSCGLQSAIKFTPSVSGDYDILVNENPCDYNPSCMNLMVVLTGVNVGSCIADFDFDTDITLTVSFTNWSIAVGALSYDWDFGDGAGTSTAASPAYTYTTAGTYTVCLYVDDGGACLDTLCTDVTVPDLPSSCSYTQPEICVVTVDSATQKNQIVWEKEVTGIIASYNIYREGLANQFSLVGNVPYANLSNFLDTTSIPAQQQYTYKISALDNCGDESPMSSPHSTLHLIMLNDAQGETKINFVWDNYKGVTVLGYNVWRYSALQGNALLSTIANTMSTFTDISPPPTGNLGYMWELALTSVCNATASTSKKVLTYNSARSNVSNRLGATGINLQSSISNLQLKVYPNPYTDETEITYTLEEEAEVTLSIYNVLGKIVQTLVLETQNSGKYQYRFSAKRSGYPAGVYILKLSVDSAVGTGKVYTRQLIEF